MATKLYFVRHGQSEANLTGCYYNEPDVALTPLGRAQAAKIGSVLGSQEIMFAAMICSPYRRALETCMIALEYPGVIRAPIVVDARVKERDFGGLAGKEITEEQNREIYNYETDASAEYGIETLEQLEERACEFVEDVQQRYSGQNVLVFSHGVFGLAVQAAAQGRPESGDLYSLPLLENGEMMVLEL